MAGISARTNHAGDNRGCLDRVELSPLMARGSGTPEIAIGLIIIAFLMFEPDGLAHRWRQIRAYWKLYPFSH